MTAETRALWHDKMQDEWAEKDCPQCKKKIKKVRVKLFCVLCPHCSVVLAELPKINMGLTLEE